MITDKFKGFAIVKKGTGRLLVTQKTLPIYWLKDVAEKMASGFTELEVITTDELIRRNQ